MQIWFAEVSFTVNIKYKNRKAGAIVIQYIPNGENRVDVFTKGLGKTKTLHHLARLTAKRGYQDLQFASQDMSGLLIENESTRE